jgi:DNA-binding CsgD family transcriptional regulator
MKLSHEQLETLRREFSLSPRETEVVDLLFQGHSSNQALAKRLGITVPGAKLHVRNAFLKCGVRDKAQLLVRCFETLALLHARQFLQGRQAAP